MPFPFTTLDPIDATSRASVVLEYMEPANIDPELGTSRCPGCNPRAVASVRYVDPSLGLGGYVQLPYAVSDKATALGDLELGVIDAVPYTNLVLHAGVTLPTGEGGHDETITAFTEATPLLRDYVLAIPDGTSVRFGLAGRWQYRYLVFQVDGGIDANLTSDTTTTYGTMFHLDAGIGVTDGRGALMLELANLSYLDSSEQGLTFGSDKPAATLDTLALSARLDWRNLEPFFAVVTPLDHDTSTAFKIAVIAGIDVMLR